MLAHLTPVSTLVCVVMILTPSDMRVSVKMDSMGEIVKTVSIKGANYLIEKIVF